MFKWFICVPVIFFAANFHDAAASKERDLPNIILILTDDLGYGDLSINGNMLIKTPNIDAIAKNGVNLTDFHASANVCTPSRVGLLTGRYAIRAGLAKQVIFPKSTHGLEGSEITVAEILKQAGYKTGIFGKWHLGHQEGMLPFDQGFDKYIGIPYSHDMKPLPLMHNNHVIADNTSLHDLTRRFTDDAITFITENKSDAFFLYLPYTAPHEPLLTEASFDHISNAGAYGDTVEELDFHIGRLLVAITNASIEENTLVMLTSDNGPWWEGSSGSHIGRKAGQRAGAYQVPFLAQWPARIPAGTVSNAMASNIDIMPTLAAIADIELPNTIKLDGKNILPNLLGSEHSAHEFLYFFDEEELTAIRTEQFRMLLEVTYNETRIPLAKAGRTLLFDLDKGPENYSVARDNAKIVKKLHKAWYEFDQEIGNIPQKTGGKPDYSFIFNLPVPSVANSPDTK